MKEQLHSGSVSYPFLQHGISMIVLVVTNRCLELGECLPPGPQCLYKLILTASAWVDCTWRDIIPQSHIVPVFHEVCC